MKQWYALYGFLYSYHNYVYCQIELNNIVFITKDSFDCQIEKEVSYTVGLCNKYMYELRPLCLVDNVIFQTILLHTIK